MNNESARSVQHCMECARTSYPELDNVTVQSVRLQLKSTVQANLQIVWIAVYFWIIELVHFPNIKKIHPYVILNDIGTDFIPRFHPTCPIIKSHFIPIAQERRSLLSYYPAFTILDSLKIATNKYYSPSMQLNVLFKICTNNTVLPPELSTKRLILIYPVDLKIVLILNNSHHTVHNRHQSADAINFYLLISLKLYRLFPVLHS